MLQRVSPLTLSIIGAIVSLSILGAIAAVLLLNAGNANGASVVLAFLAPTIVSLLALVRAEGNANQSLTMHEANQVAIAQLSSKIDGVGAIAAHAADAGASAAVAAQAAQQTVQSSGGPIT